MIFTGGTHTNDLTFCFESVFEKYGNIAKESYCRQNWVLSVRLSSKNQGKSTSFSHLSVAKLPSIVNWIQSHSIELNSLIEFDLVQQSDLIELKNNWTIELNRTFNFSTLDFFNWCKKSRKRFWRLELLQYISLFILSQGGMVTNPAIWLALSGVRILLSLTMVTVTAWTSAGEIVVLVNFSVWTGSNRQPFAPFTLPSTSNQRKFSSISF